MRDRMVDITADGEVRSYGPLDRLQLAGAALATELARVNQKHPFGVNNATGLQMVIMEAIQRAEGEP